ncbi:hypothetical protein BK126_17520 [Paenibacillus sp. FSL H7-0326]|uniref:hypothetical protein n=1 Tax=Paenibacillus sp. FSL H7-0326 TaxID=1921144 RepID=UPI00096D47E0|nr:hypothetical protein [Paenibacillus sp. FSL H7-0326]OMC67394.1 hypothetical protein BK126_17520 [Paenibacillus sp. FSL H7-0326]
MNQRFRITRSMQDAAEALEISLDECKAYFAEKDDFTYETVLTVKGPESTMSIKGDFFMWELGEMRIPFRHYNGDIYVAISQEEVVPKMMEVASDLRADIVEG